MSSTDAAARRHAVPDRPEDERRPAHATPAGTGPTGREPAPADADELLAQLQEKLASLPVIEQAKGIVMQRYQLDPDAAFTILVRWSQWNNTKIREVCQLVVDLVTDTAAFEVLLVALQQQALQNLRSQGRGRERLVDR